MTIKTREKNGSLNVCAANRQINLDLNTGGLVMVITVKIPLVDSDFIRGEDRFMEIENEVRDRLGISSD